MNWTVPRMWTGRTVAVLASGPSMSAAAAQAVRDAGIPAIVTNTTFRLAPWADVLYAADMEWWTHPTNRDAREFAGLKVSVQELPGVLTLQNTGNTGFDPDPRHIRTGGTSGYQAVHVAIHAGARRILLCGFDGRGGHWHGEHPPGLREASVERFAERFEALAVASWERNVEIVNCTPGSAVLAFRFGTLAEELPAERETA